jgi:hypothetical protein
MSKEKDTKQTLLPEDSHANHSALQEKEEEQTMTATSGMKLLGLLGSANRGGLLEKMLKELLTSKTAWYSDRCKMIWKKRVSKCNVLLFQLQASVRGIKEKEYGSLLKTPTTQDARIGPNNIGGNKHRMKRGSIALADQILFPNNTKPKMYPTPSASNCIDVVMPAELVEENSRGWTVTRKKTGKKFGAKLNDVVNKINEKPGGKLNAEFVEFLMAYPSQWTKIDPTE